MRPILYSPALISSPLSLIWFVNSGIFTLPGSVTISFVITTLAMEAPLEYTVTESPRPRPEGPTLLLALLYTGVASVRTKPATPSDVVSLKT